MPDFIPMTAILFLFYTIFLGQIFYLSIYIPGKICSRVEYVMEQFPPEEYPKLYPSPYDRFAEESGKRKLRIFKGINYAIAIIGLVILQQMIMSDYRPAAQGGDEIFVLLYFFLQFIPIGYAQLKEYMQYKLMRATFTSKKRTADLSPRRLFDFVSPVYVGVAVVAYVGWLYMYLLSRDFGGQPHWEIYLTVFGMSGVQIMFVVNIARTLMGKKENPYQSYADQLRQIGAVIKIMLFASIGMSVFLTITQLVDQYDLEVFDPVLSSLYFQFCAVFGVGFAFKTMQVEKADFEVYRDDSAGASS